MKTRLTIMVLLILRFLIDGSGTATAADLNSVLAKHLEAIGGREAVAALKSIEAYSSIEYMGISGKTTTMFKLPTMYYTHIDLGMIKETKGFDGIIAWTTGANGVTRRDNAEELKPMFNELYLAGYSFLFSRRNPGRTEYRGDTLIDGSAYHQLAMFPEGGDSLLAYINAESGRMEYRRERITGIWAVTAYHDFRKIAGVEMPFATRVETTDAPYEMTSWVDSIRINKGIGDSLFIMPGGDAVDFQFPPDADSAVIGLELRRNRPLVKVKVNGQGPFLFMLDSGSATTILSKSLAEDLGIKIIGDIPARGVGGYGSIGFGEVDSLEIGSLSWRLKHIMVFDFSTLAGGAPNRHDGILGYDFFARFPMLINFDDNDLIIFDPGRSELPETGEAVDIEIYFKVPVMEVLLDGYPVRLVLDLGAEMGLIIRGHSRWCKAMSDLIDNTGTELEIVGIGGIHKVKKITLSSLQLGKLQVDEPTALVSEEDAGMPFPDYIEGILGMRILKQYKLFINYPAGRVSLGE